MATGNLTLGHEQGQTSARQRVVNDFSINVATVNGSGSQSANSVLLKSIFGMGVPVTWFIDANGKVVYKQIGLFTSDDQIKNLVKKYLKITL